MIDIDLLAFPYEPSLRLGYAKCWVVANPDAMDLYHGWIISDSWGFTWFVFLDQLCYMYLEFDTPISLLLTWGLWLHANKCVGPDPLTHITRRVQMDYSFLDGSDNGVEFGLVVGGPVRIGLPILTPIQWNIYLACNIKMYTTSTIRTIFELFFSTFISLYKICAML